MENKYFDNEEGKEENPQIDINFNVDGLWTPIHVLGVFLAGGISFAYNSNIFLSILQSVLSWAYVAYKLVSELLIGVAL